MAVSTASKVIQGAKASLRLAAGAWQFARHRTTPNYAYQSLIQLFCITGGWSNDVLAGALAVRHPAYELGDARGILGDEVASSVPRIMSDLKENGYHIFEQRLPQELCDRLRTFALTQEAVIRPTDQDAQGAFGSRKAVYDPAAPQGIIYQFEQETLVNQLEIQDLITDQSIISVAQAYIGSQPVLDEVNLWWSTAYGARPDANAAQLYHFDMDRIRWLKFFFYLTDVGPENGPHCFVAGSHKSGGIPAAFLDRGYVRIPDEEVVSTYGPERLIEFTGPRGTIIAEDTRGLHKGRPVLRGDRLVLEFEFSNSLFGATSPHGKSRIRRFHESAAEQFVSSYPRMYENWLTSR